MMESGQSVITEKQARQITGGRKPLVPIKYEEACRALVECRSIDDAKYFSDKADALSAWAKIYKNDEAGIESRRLKLHAYRRMGQIAYELRPNVRKGSPPGITFGSGSLPGAPALLREAGLKLMPANQASKLARMSEENFNAIVNLPRPPSPSAARGMYVENSTVSDAWRLLVISQSANIQSFSYFINKHPDPKILAMGLRKDEALKVRRYVHQIIDWLDEFERHLPKGE